jgi:hypothetical protein
MPVDEEDFESRSSCLCDIWRDSRVAEFSIHPKKIRQSFKASLLTLNNTISRDVNIGAPVQL